MQRYKRTELWQNTGLFSNGGWCLTVGRSQTCVILPREQRCVAVKATNWYPWSCSVPTIATDSSYLNQITWQYLMRSWLTPIHYIGIAQACNIRNHYTHPFEFLENLLFRIYWGLNIFTQKDNTNYFIPWDICRAEVALDHSLSRISCLCL